MTPTPATGSPVTHSGVVDVARDDTPTPAHSCWWGCEQPAGVLVITTAVLMMLVSVAAGLMMIDGWAVAVVVALCALPHAWVRAQRSRGVPVSHALVSGSATIGVLAAAVVQAWTAAAPVAVAVGVLVAAGVTITVTDLRSWVIAKETCWWAAGCGVAASVLAVATGSSALVWSPDVLAGVVIVAVNAVLVLAAGISWLAGSGGFGDVRFVLAGWLLTGWWVDPGAWGYGCVAGIGVAAVIWLARRRRPSVVEGAHARGGVIPAGGVYAVMYIALACACVPSVLT